MEDFSLNSSISYAAKFNHTRLSTRGRRSMVCCYNGQGMETGSLVLSNNAKDEGIGIVKFLRGKTFLITGATGFLGKVLIEKMLRTAPDVRKIFVVIKAKNQEAVEERLKTNLSTLPSYVNGQRQGRIMEKPLCIGETIVGETVNGNHQVPLPKLSVEDEIKIVVDAKKTLGDDSLIQAIKELGMQRDLAKLLNEHFSSSPVMDSTGTPVSVPKMKLFSSTEDFSNHLRKDAINRTGLGALANLDGKLSQKARIHLQKISGTSKLSSKFDNRNTQRLMGCMSKEERQLFGFDVENINWKDYIVNVHIPGLRRHVMKGRGNS
ncbi:hypothetical protein SASPL_143404 [Salvia splendens]|uniref:Fatty acyl-CoA reductase n=1 Tax=Salvia splendens TaxID=180675 RepID=A0A8X8WLJ9_SALSN|nr:hypothetical protein SASPL_143404 [Salvia splendens]